MGQGINDNILVATNENLGYSCADGVEVVIWIPKSLFLAQDVNSLKPFKKKKIVNSLKKKNSTFGQGW